MFNILNRFALEIIAPKAAIRAKYSAFKELLRHDRLCHKRLAELEELYYQNRKVDLNLIRRLHSELAAGVSAMVDCLDRMAPASYFSLRAYARQIEYYGRIALTPLAVATGSSCILSLDGSYPDDLRTGGKGLHLCQLKQQLGLPVPQGFIVSTSAFHFFLEANKLRPRINSLLSQVDIRSDQSLSATAAQLMRMVEEAEMPAKLAAEIQSSVAALARRTGAERFAVRSSALGEDSAISFAGQYESVLGVGAAGILPACKKVFASKYSAKAICYRINAGLLDEDTAMALLVLEMVDASLSGVVTSRDGTGSAGEGVVIHYTEGLGDKLVGGRCTPETVVVRREEVGFRVERGPPPAAPAGNLSQSAPAGGEGRSALSVTDEQALQLASWARQIEKWYQTPQEIEWSLDRRGDLFLLQARPMLIQEKIAAAGHLDTGAFPVLIGGGETASRGAACGPVYRIDREEQLADVPAGAVLVTVVTPPSFVLVLDRVCAVVAEQGSVADHFASVAREAGVPVLVNAAGAGTVLAAGRVVTVCADLGQVFTGCIEIIMERYPPQRVKQQDTPVRQAFARASRFIFPLQLVKPAEPSFAPDNCRSLHDLIRFIHEKGVQAMFAQTTTMFVRRSATTLLDAPIPLRIYLLDMDVDISKGPDQEAKPGENNLRVAAPLRAVLRGLTHPGIIWRHHAHFDWKNFSEMTMAGGIVNSSDPAFASYAVVARDYLNLNMRFGYHFVILDALCGAKAEENHIKLRFAGGGGEAAGITLRLAFIAEILRRLGFSVQTKGDLLDAQLMRYSQEDMLEKLDVVGRLLAATTLMDMVIRDEDMVNRMVAGFMNEDYDFSWKGEG
ncbi:MAG: PEP/pyruvate-binding domain-containing protein [Desulfobulbaceae bacterium]